MSEEKQAVLSRDGKETGYVICEMDEGCEIEDCMGTVYLVDWPESGMVSECCSRGMDELPDGRWQIA